MNFMAVKETGKRSGFVIYSYLKDSSFTAVKRDTKGEFERGASSIEGIRNGYLFKWYIKRVRGCTLGTSLY